MAILLWTSCRCTATCSYDRQAIFLDAMQCCGYDGCQDRSPILGEFFQPCQPQNIDHVHSKLSSGCALRGACSEELVNGIRKARSSDDILRARGEATKRSFSISTRVLSDHSHLARSPFGSNAIMMGTLVGLSTSSALFSVAGSANHSGPEMACSAVNEAGLVSFSLTRGLC